MRVLKYIANGFIIGALISLTASLIVLVRGRGLGRVNVGASGSALHNTLSEPRVEVVGFDEAVKAAAIFPPVPRLPHAAPPTRGTHAGALPRL